MCMSTASNYIYGSLPAYWVEQARVLDQGYKKSMVKELHEDWNLMEMPKILSFQDDKTNTCMLVQQSNR